MTGAFFVPEGSKKAQPARPARAGERRTMNVFEAVKSGVTARQAAEYYGIKVNKRGMARCPFHNDRTPSMKIDKRYHCFACQADGDVVDFTAGLFGLTTKEAAEKLAHDFGIDYQEDRMQRPGPMHPKANKTKSDDEKFSEERRRIFRIYSDYLYLLKRWRLEFAPAPEDEEWDSRFVEAIMQQTHVEYVLDVLMSGTVREVADLIFDLAKETEAVEKKFAELAAIQEDDKDGN